MLTAISRTDLKDLPLFLSDTGIAKCRCCGSLYD